MLNRQPQTPTPLWVKAVLGVVLVSAFGVYLYVATLHQARTDEAVFGRASLAILDGDLLLHDWRVMKPFMVYYAQAASRLVFSDSPLAGRIPGLIASLLCLWLLFRIARRWFDPYVGLVAAALLAFSPYVLDNFPTGRADALALVFVLAAIELAGRERIGWAGFAYALAFCTRQLVALSFPLVIVFVLLAGHLGRIPGVAWWRTAGRQVWRFFLGTLPPLAVLFVWSLFEKIPFAWLVNELQSDKYATGSHLGIGFVAKLQYWLNISTGFFGQPELGLLAVAVLIPAVALSLVATRAVGRWTTHDRPQLAVLAWLSVFVLFFYLLNSTNFFTMYVRFLVPVVPWVMLIAAVCLVGAVRFGVSRLPGLRFVLPVALAALLLLGLLPPLANHLHQIGNSPIPEDDIPPAVRWLDRHTQTGAVLFTSDYGPECDYATWGTRVRSTQFDRRPERLPSLLIERLNRELYLYLDQRDVDRWEEQLAQTLQPHFALEAVAAEVTRAGRLYRIAVQSCGGIENDQITYVADGSFVTEPLTCEVLGRLLTEAFTRQRKNDWDRPVRWTWRHCQVPFNFDALAWSVQSVEYHRIGIAQADFHYRQPVIDWNVLLTARRLVISQAEEARAEFYLTADDLARFIHRKNKNLEEVTVEVGSQAIAITARARLPFWQPTVAINGVIRLDGQRLLFRLREAKLGDWLAPEFIIRYVESVMNPILSADLSAWSLKAAEVRLEASQGEDPGAIIIEAVQR